MCSVISVMKSVSDYLVDPYLWPTLNNRPVLLPTFDIGGQECMMLTRDDACCWIVYCHGNSVTLADLWESGIPKAITESCRCNFIAPKYPDKDKYGESYDKEVIASVKRAYEQLQNDSQCPVYVVGRSIGAAIATQSCQESQPSGLVLISGFSSVRHLSPLGLRWLVPDRLNNLKGVESLSHVPTLIIHGEKDSLVLPENAEYIADAHGNADVVIIPDMTHTPMPANINAICNHIRKLIGKNSAIVARHHYLQWTNRTS